jgi:hypothetical protein
MGDALMMKRLRSLPHETFGPILYFPLALALFFVGFVPLINGVTDAQSVSTLRSYNDNAWSCGTASTSKTFGFNAMMINVANDGAVSAFFNFAGTTATTASVEVKAGEKYSAPIPANYTSVTSCITSSSSASIRIHATR